MRIYTYFITLAAISNSIECSSDSGESLRIERDFGSSSHGIQNSPDRITRGRIPVRARSRSPDSQSPPIKVLGYSLEQLGYLRLISRANQDIQLEFRNYNFPTSVPLMWKPDAKSYRPLPAKDHIVLSTSSGDIYAILADDGCLHGIYRKMSHNPRAKMNMVSKAISTLTLDEKKECPVGKNYPVFPQSFIKAFSKSDSLQFKWSPNGEIIPGVSPSARQRSPGRSSTPGKSLIRARSMSPPDRPPSDQVLGYTIEELGYLRLIPSTNQNQRFEFRRHVFASDKSIRIRINEKGYVIDPTREYFVLVTSNGDAFAILDYSGTLRGIYRTDKTRSRIKINIMSGAIVDMTADEKRDCQVGKNYPIFPKRFTADFSNYNSLQPEQNPRGERDSSNSPVRQHSPDRTSHQEPPFETRSTSPPGRPPSREILGYTLAQLGYIRLIPKMNPHRQFEFRKYVFPPFRGIHVMLGHGKFVLVPEREHIVLSTSDGDVFAILEYTGILYGTYETNRETNWNYTRMRINMITRKVNYMTASEMKECRVGKTYRILPRWFDKFVSNENSLQHVYQ